MDAKLVLLSVFTFRWRGVLTDAPILFTDFDPKNLRMFVIHPPKVGSAGVTAAYEHDWNELSKWSIEERPMSDAEFSEINALCANYDLEKERPKEGARFWLEPIGWKTNGLTEYRTQGYIQRPRSRASTERRWVVSLNVVEVKLAKGEPLE